ncbi:MAG TPA: hypothetical protein VK399_10155, partial [Longimicrobiaceae bacterium]|nr:hypothetical protein [Longimicrobiaceae bacterium]
MAEILKLVPIRGGLQATPDQIRAQDTAAAGGPRRVSALRIVREAAPRDPERARLLRELEAADPAGDATLARQAALAARVLDAPFALVSLADGERHLVPAASGLPEA